MSSPLFIRFSYSVRLFLEMCFTTTIQHSQADRIDGQITQTKAELSRLLEALDLTVDEVIDVKEDDEES